MRYAETSAKKTFFGQKQLSERLEVGAMFRILLIVKV